VTQGAMKIEILGTGCPKCRTLAANVEKAVAELGLTAEVTKVTDISEIVARGVMLTPSLVVNGEVVAVGKVSSAEELKGLLGRVQ
jgi:small redox-active disulfide protein 2